MTGHLQQFGQQRNVRPPDNTGKKFPIELLTEQEVSQIIKRCSPRCPTGARNRAILALMYRGCLRVSEAIGLAVRDLDVQSGMLTIRHGKGNRRRVIGLDGGTLALIHAWLGKRQKVGLQSQSLLFCTLKGGPVSRHYVKNLVRRLARKAGISKRTHPHLFRHCGAVALLKDGMNVPEVSQVLGRSNIATTATYLNHVCPVELVSKMNTRTWNL